ncbi:hypothetical protein FVB9532_00312 [Mesonia oceanica]|uniref:Uncharacterized protein n=2 Tax=Flavobacteriaceae TaxID=49546 RepID=A0AC61Y5D8_9FLAO|nr:hypothetical protein FVB9532_00312 [Mesonia oceanica]
MLLNNACLEVSNISISSNVSVASFDNNNGDFPISEGVIIRSGEAQYTAGMYTGENISTQQNSNGDADLEEVANSSGQVADITDVAYLQFDFVPISNKLSFDFLLASNEYGEFQCISNDVLAFVLTNLNTGESNNIGLIPETPIPVSVKNIRDNAYNPECSSEYEEYFDVYNVDNPASSTLNMRGHTKVLNASSGLEVGAPYRIRFIIGDSNDPDYDSAIFLAAGSFETKVDLGEDFTLCGNESFTLDTEIDASVYSHTWKKDDEVIQGETSSSYTVTEGGTYSVTIANSDGSCVVTDEIVINHFLIGQPADLEFCKEASIQIRLRQIFTDEIALGEPLSIYDYVYYIGDEDYENQTNPVEDEDLGDTGIYNLNVDFEVITIYAIITSTDDSGCEEVISFDVIIHPLPEVEVEQESVIECTEYILPSLPDGYTYEGGYVAGDAIVETGSYLIITPPNQYGCTNYLAFTVQLIADFILPEFSCGEFVVPTPPEGTSFYTEIDGPYGGGEIIEPGTIYTEDVTIYFFAEIDGEICKNEAIVKTILPAPDLGPDETIINCNNESYTLPSLDTYGLPDSNIGYFLAPNGEGPELAEGDIIESSTIVYVYAQVGSCTDSKKIFVRIIPDYEDVDACGEYTLPYLPGNLYYHTEAAGEGQVIEADSTLTVSQTIYVYYFSSAEENCTDNLSFYLEVNQTPEVDSLQNAGLQCDADTYILPALQHGNYYTESNGEGVQLNEGDVIAEPQTIYIYNEEDGCSDETFFEVIDDPLPPIQNFADEYECNSYTLPEPTGGNFYTAPFGGGTQLQAGEEITETQLIYIYNDGGPGSPCYNQKEFTVNIVHVDVLGQVEDVDVCDQFILPTLNQGNYYTESDAGGTMLSSGTIITESQEIYIYAQESNNRITCTSETSFTVTVSQTPDLPGYNNVEACGSYTLPNLQEIADTNIGYYWEAGGNNPISSDEETFSTAGTFTVYVYAEAANNPQCFDEEEFEITIYPLLDFEVEGGVVCLDAETGDVVSPFLLQSGIDPTEFQIDWYLNGSLVHTGENYYAEEPGEYTVQTIKLTPEVGADCNYNPTTVTVIPSSQPEVKVKVSEDFAEVATISVEVVEGYGEYMYQLDNNFFQTSNYFYNVSSGTHTITVKGITGDCGETTVEVDVINYPRFFTPNQDGVNDTWNISDLKNNKEAVIYIHNRFGKLLTSFSPSRGFWDGTYNGKQMPSNDYWFKVEYVKDGKEKQFVANFTLKR